MDDRELKIALAMESMRWNNGYFYEHSVQDAYNWIRGIPKPKPQPPVDNDHVADGATQFTEEEIAANG